MKKARNLWRDLPQGGSRYGSVFTRLFLLLCMLATTQAGWADNATYSIDSPAQNAYTDATSGISVVGTRTTATIDGQSKGVFSAKTNQPLYITSVKANIKGISFDYVDSSSGTGNATEDMMSVLTATNAALAVPASGTFTASYTPDGGSATNVSSLSGIAVPKNQSSHYSFSLSLTAAVSTLVINTSKSNAANIRNIKITYDDAITAPTLYATITPNGTNSYSVTGNGSMTASSVTNTNATISSESYYQLGSSANTYTPAESLVAGDIVVYTVGNAATSSKAIGLNGGIIIEKGIANQSYQIVYVVPSSASSISFTRNGAETYLKDIKVYHNPSSSTKSDLTTFAFSSTTGESMTVGDADANPHAWSATYGGNDVSSTISSNVTYVSDNTSAVTIVNGKIHAVAAGEANITAQLSGNATYNDKTTTNSYTVTVSAAASALAISTQPVGASYNQGASATALSVTATGGTGSYSYQWYSNTASSTTTPTPTAVGTNSASYTPSTATVGTTYYYCVVTDNASATVTSNIVGVTVNGASESPANNPAVVDKSGTGTYGNFKFLDVANTASNAESTDGSIEYLTYTKDNLVSMNPAWYTGGTSHTGSISGSYNSSTMSGFLSWSGSLQTFSVQEGSNYHRPFYVTGTSGVAILGTDNSSSDASKILRVIVEEVTAGGSLSTVGTDALGTNTTSPYVLEHLSPLDPSKFYKVTVCALGSNNSKFGQIRFTKGTATPIATYDVNCTTGIEHGSISSNVAKAAEGTVVTITGTPVASYGLGTVTVTEATSGNNVATTGTGNTRTFIMPDEDVNVTATFVKLPTISKGAEVNGSFNTSPESYAAAGTTVTVNATPASGYSVGTITVTDGSSNPVTVTDGQFTMPNSNVTVNVTFDVAAVSAGDKWNFTTMSDADMAAYKADGTNWNTSRTDYYSNKFTPTQGTATGIISTTIQQIKNLKFIRATSGNMNASDVRIYLPTSTAEGYLKFNGSGRGLIIDKSELSTGDKVTVDFIGGSDSKGFTITNGSVESIKSATRTSKEFTVSDGEQDLQLVVNDGSVKLYKITIGQTVDVAEPTFGKADGDGYDGTTDLSVTVIPHQTATSPATATTYWAYSKTALDRDALVAAATAAGNTGGTATVPKATVNEQDITLYAVTKYETNPGQPDNVTYYSDVVSATYPYTGKVTPSVSASNINIQQGQQRTIEPTITMPDGTAFDPENDTENPGLTTIYDYFDFTFQITAKSGNGNGNEQYITVDGVSDINQTPTTGGVVNTKVGNNTADPNNTATVHIVATQKSPFSGSTWPFNGTSFETDVTVTVIAKTDAQTMSYWWDPQFTVPVTDDDFRLDGSVSVFDKKTITNGRMLYVKPAEGYTVYVAAGIGSSHPTVSKVSGTSKKNGVCYYEYRKNDPTDEYPDAPIDYNGIALLIENNDFGDPSNEWTDAKDNTEVKNFYLSLQAYNAAGDPEGSVVRCTFPLTNDNSKRPGNVTYNPSETDAVRNTAETVLTSGVEGAYVYGKFSSTSTSYNTPTLIQESGINGGQTNVGVFSTEVDKRKISAVQVAKNTTDNYYYIGKRSTNQYKYLFASEIEMTGKTFNTVVTAKDADMSTAKTIDIKSLISGITYYNKDSKKDINIADSIQAHSGETAPVTKKEIDRVTYSIQYFNGAGGTGVTDGTTLDGSVVTIGKHSGYVVVTATYPGGYSKKVNKRTSTTDEATATYTIYITDPNEQIPTITPNSRNFIGEQSFIIQAPADWNAMYMVVAEEDAEKDANYNAATATYSSDNPKVGMLEKGEYIRLTVTKTSKVRAFAYDPSVTEHNKPGQANTTSKEVTATYTKLDPLKAPTLSPYGTSENPHIRTVKSQTVIATTNDAVAGLEVYYTLDGSEPTTSSLKYNGSEKITITAASTTIKAIAYDPASERISPVTTGVYIYTGTIAQPVFYVSTDNGSNWDTGHTSGTVTVNPSDLIKIETNASGSEIYYTMDGSTPTSGEAKVYEGAFSIVKNTTGKAIAIKDDASSPITTVEFVLAEDKEDLWEAVEETTPKGKLARNDRYVSTALKEAGTSTTSSKAVKFLTATFGGMDDADWNKTSIGEKTQGSPLDGVGEYSIITTRDVWDETDTEVNNTANTVHGKTFALPAKGNFVRFEPERDGDLTIWLLQQGGLHYTDDGDLCNQFIRLRPVYMFDEKGTSIPATDIKSSARLSDNWNDLDVSDTPNEQGRYGNWVAKNKSQNGVVNKYYTEGESEAIYNMYKEYLTNHDISAGAPIAPFATTGSVQTMLGELGLNGTGYVMPSGGNVKYTFPVKGGKTYYFFGYRTKLAVRGFQFHPSSETVEKSVTVADNTADIVATIKAGETGGTIAKDEICNVTYTRAFTNGKWAAVTFPFSVSVAQMKKVFGDHVDLIHFDNVSGSKINFKRHWYPMIVAGTPVFIKPSQDMGTSVTFEGVRIEAESVNAVSGDGGYKMTGSFSPATINVGDYYISGGKLAVRKGNSINTNACRSWLTADSNNGARFDLTTGTADAFAEEAWSVIGNPQPFVASDETVVTYINGVQEDGIINNIFDGPTGIYTINGQLIRKDATSLEGLSKGIYIVNGKKIAVK